MASLGNDDQTINPLTFYELIGSDEIWHNVIKLQNVRNPSKWLCASVNVGLSGYNSSFGF